jgi:hypothetical protein
VRKVRHVPETGRLIRILAIPILGIFAIASVYYSFRPASFDLLNVIVRYVFAILSLSGLIRCAVIGIWVGEDVLIVRSWYTTRKIPMSTSLHFEVAEYSGWINWFNADGSGRWLKAIRIQSDARDWTAMATISLNASARRQVGFLNSLIASEGGESPGGGLAAV